MFVLAWSVMRFHSCHDKTIVCVESWLSSLVFNQVTFVPGLDNLNSSYLGFAAPSAVCLDR
jgi:hypothetical protein